MTRREHLRVIVWSFTAWCAIGVSAEIATAFLVHIHANEAERIAAESGPPLVPPDQPAEVAVYCLPGDDPMPRFAANCRAAKVIRVQEYNLTLKAAADALIAAHGRGADVRVVLDRSQATDARSQARRLHEAGIPVLIDSRHQLSHVKCVIWDGAESMGGSMNVSASGVGKNAELAVFIRGEQANAVMLRNWDKHAGHSIPYTPR